MLNLASCREKSQQLAAAWAAYTEALRLARTSNNPKLAEVATNHLDKLERRVSRLTLAVPADHNLRGLELLRNGAKLDAGSWNKPQLVDGGSYTITARAPGRTTWTVTRQIAVEGDRVQIEVPKLVDPTAVVAVAPPSPPRQPWSSRRRRRRRDLLRDPRPPRARSRIHRAHAGRRARADRPRAVWPLVAITQLERGARLG